MSKVKSNIDWIKEDISKVNYLLELEDDERFFLGKSYGMLTLHQQYGEGRQDIMRGTTKEVGLFVSGMVRALSLNQEKTLGGLKR